MILVDLERAPNRLRGRLNNWLQELRAGLFVGDYNPKIREQIWELITDNIGPGNAVMIWPANNEQGFKIMSEGVNRRQPVEKDGLTLVKYDADVDSDQQSESVGSLSPWTYSPANDSCASPRISASDLVNDQVVQQESSGRGKDLGQRVHVFAELWAEGRDVEPTEPGVEDKKHIRDFLEDCSGQLKPEVSCTMTLKREQGDPRQVEIRGLADLVHIHEDCLRIIDYKTDPQRTLEEEYRKQLSAYYYSLGTYHSDKQLSCHIFYSHSDRLVDLEPLPSDEFEQLVWETYENTV